MIKPKNEAELDEWRFGMLKKKKVTERMVHKQVAMYLRAQYPKVRFITTLDGEYFGRQQAEAVRTLQHSRGAPDLLIFAQRGQYHGLALEIKRTYSDAYKKDGSLKKSEHLKEQNDWHWYLRGEGWYATFGCGFDECKELIDEYLNLKL